MKKQIAILAVCLVLVAALGGALFFLMKADSAGEASSSGASSSVTLVEKTAYDLDTIVVKNEAGAFTIKNLGEDKYEIEGISGVEMSTKLAATAKAAAKVEAKDVVNEAPEDLAAYGLAAPRAQFTAHYTDGSTFTLLLGDEAPGGNGTYAKEAGADTVYLFSSYTFENYLLDKLAFISTTVTEPPGGAQQQQAATVMPEKVTFGGSLRPAPIEIAKQNNEQSEMAAQSYGFSLYQMNSPKKRGVDSEEATNALASLLSITAESVAAYQPTPEQIKEYGLDTPYSTADFTYKEEAEASGTQHVSLRASAKNEEGICYLQKDGAPLVYAVRADSLLWYEMEYQDFISSMVLLPFIDEVKTVTVAGAGASYVFSLEGEGDALKVTLGGQEVDVKQFRTYYQTLIGLPGEEFTEDKPAAGAAPLLTITYEYRDSKRPADKVELLPGSTRKVFLYVNGEGEFYTKQGYVDTILQNSAGMAEGKEPAPLY